MARMGRRMIPPINTVKHYVQRSNVTIADGTTSVTSIVDAVIPPATGATHEVREGSVVKAIYLEVWYMGAGATGVDTQFILVFSKAPSGLAAFSFSDTLNLQAADNKKNIFFTSQGVIGGSDTQAIPVHRGWIKIPKGKQRMGLGDRLLLNTSTIGAAMQLCAIFIYKEYT